MPRKKINVGVIFGGRSGEHEVSIVSAQAVMKAFDKSKYNVIPVGITKQGVWLSGAEAVKFLKKGIKKIVTKTVLAPDATERGLMKVSRNKVSFNQKLDVVFPVLHGTYGEDGTVQGLFELANIPYVGAGVLGSAVGMDKVIQKEIFKQNNLPIVKYVWFLKSDWQKGRANILRLIEKKLKYPVFVKPVNLGSSVGISKARNRAELVPAVKLAAKFDRKIIVEKSAGNIREIEVAVLGNDHPESTVPGEIIPSNEFYDYNAKYIDGKSQAIIPARLPRSVIKKVRETAVAAYRCLDLSGMSRVDFFVLKGSNKLILNEVNTIPGFTSISMYPKLWQATGLSYKKLLDKLINFAIIRHKEKNKLKTSFDSGSDWYK
ncbi:D-alanine--D-alanine ligase [Candidatus Parcubacteria bacterium]|nr:MAG: D-alanine--D-alanine ligase [Candidatus Parcubacteria bacterium]